MPNYQEKDLESFIESYLLENNGYIKRVSQNYDKDLYLDKELFIEFLELIGVQMPDPVPAQGLLQFHAHETVEEPAPVPEGTQLYARQEEIGRAHV